MSPEQIVARAIPGRDKDFAEHILWGRTPFPMVKVTARAFYKAAIGYHRASQKSLQLCDMCPRPAVGVGLCLRCDVAMAAGKSPLPKKKQNRMMKMWNNWLGGTNSGTTPVYPITTTVTTAGTGVVNTLNSPTVTTSASLYQGQMLAGQMLAQQLLAQRSVVGGGVIPFEPVDDTGTIEVRDGRACSIKLPDGTVIVVEADGSFAINDKDAKVTYRASRVREFNSFLNASDKLESFIRFCGEVGVRQGEVLDIPIRHFIAWLVIEAARADDETAPDVPLVPDLQKITRPRCGCGRFIARKKVEKKINFCRTKCFETAMAA